MSPQDDHVIEFAKQFGWDAAWMEKQVKKKSKKKLEEEAARFSQDVGEMLGAVSRDAASSASASQVVPRDQSSSGAVLPTQAPQVKAPPPVKATPPAPPSTSVEPLPLAGASPQATPPEFSTPPPPPRRRRASREDRLAVIARTAQSKAMAVPVRDANVDGSRESRDVEIEDTEGDEAEARELKTCVICFEVCDPSDGEYPLEALVWLPGVRRFASLIVLGAQMDAIGPMDIHSSGHLDSPLKCLHVMIQMMPMLLRPRIRQRR